MTKKLGTKKTFFYIELNNILYKVSSSSLGIWEEFESLDEGYTAEEILNKSQLELAKAAREFVKININKNNPGVDMDLIHNELSDLDIDQLISIFNKVTNIDKELIINSSEFNDLTPEDQKGLKKKSL